MPNNVKITIVYFVQNRKNLIHYFQSIITSKLKVEDNLLVISNEVLSNTADNELRFYAVHAVSKHPSIEAFQLVKNYYLSKLDWQYKYQFGFQKVCWLNYIVEDIKNCFAKKNVKLESIHNEFIDAIGFLGHEQDKNELSLLLLNGLEKFNLEDNQNNLFRAISYLRNPNIILKALENLIYKTSIIKNKYPCLKCSYSLDQISYIIHKNLKYLIDGMGCCVTEHDKLINKLNDLNVFGTSKEKVDKWVQQAIKKLQQNKKTGFVYRHPLANEISHSEYSSFWQSCIAVRWIRNPLFSEYETYKNDNGSQLKAIVRIAENQIRAEFDLPLIGEKWISETQVFNLVKSILPELEVIQHARLQWLGMQSLDVYIPEYKVAIEYMGKQHYEPVKYFGGEENFQKTVLRDKQKAQLCKENGVQLFYIKYTEKIDIQAIIKLFKKTDIPIKF